MKVLIIAPAATMSIWKARNDHRFHAKSWTPVQVHNAAAAHMNTRLQAIMPLASTTSTTPAATHQLPLLKVS